MDLDNGWHHHSSLWEYGHPARHPQSLCVDEFRDSAFGQLLEDLIDLDRGGGEE